ncbi:AMP-binding protein [Nocardioides salsibiostraticola]
MPDLDSPVVPPHSAPSLDEGVVSALRRHGPRTALVGGSVPDGALSYVDLARRVSQVRDRLGSTRRLVLIEATNDADTVITYLGALAGGHPVLLTGPDRSPALIDRFDVDVVASGAEITERRTGTAHDLHPDLALLLSTSGTTGSAKLVRLSRENLLANARSIAEYLALRPDDLAATTLPLHYCYGLSVLHSHLLAGAGVLLTDRSVASTCFWEEFEEAGATSFAGVPHTFDLLERSGWAERDLPRLRYTTQAGGRMAPEDVRRWAARGQRNGFDFFVMYGQTEATARMAYLPPDLAAAAPDAIGTPIAGGRFEIEDATGELVYFGPNVMLGYAENAADLARGREIDSLRTGDLARRREDGLFEIVGRSSRVAKVFGLRVDLDLVERTLAARGVVVAAADGGDRLVVAACSAARPVDEGRVRRLISEEFGLPAAGVVVLALDDLPRLASGKVDYSALVEVRGAPATAHTLVEVRGAPATSLETTAADLTHLYSRLLGRPATESDSFVGLGGDSLSYVECSLQLEAALGRLPANWPTRTIADLLAEPPRSTRRRWGTPVETNVLLRAFAIISIVGTHANLLTMLGGAHLLLGIVGFNFGRFQVTGVAGRPRLARMLRSIGRIVVPSALVIGTVSLYTEGLGWRQILLVNSLTTSTWSEPGWYYWFIESLVYTLVAMAALLAIPWVARLEARFRFGLPFGLAVAGLLTRYGVVSLGGEDEIHRAHVIFWLFALGWATAKADRLGHRVLLSVLLVASVPGFFSGFERNAYVVIGMLLLVWVTQLRVPVIVGRLAGLLAGASLWIYLVHWQIYPLLEYRIPLLATLFSLLAGVLAWRLSTKFAEWGVEVRQMGSRGSSDGEPRTGSGLDVRV